ncbi:hypothetical protein MTR67_032009 [Solanum verrucosum]|uniref:Uncharacterized protein n=1 Tax=Solanum verrucosum TaxID=315347 RepID=A0AAF0U3Q1_SOLVR|nr:hypothetical protein MTR67_032009 [Solanum verrucosum]
MLGSAKTFVAIVGNADNERSESLASYDGIDEKILSEDASSRFQLFDGFPKLYQRAEAKIAQARSGSQHEPLIIRASTQWYACDDVAWKRSETTGLQGNMEKAWIDPQQVEAAET